MGRATDLQFDELHALTVDTIVSEIERYRTAREPIPPALLAQAIKMLKDNGIDKPSRSRLLRDTLIDELPKFDDFSDTTLPHLGVPH